MAFGVPALSAPAQTAPTNPIGGLNSLEPTANAPQGGAAPLATDRITRSDSAANPNGITMP
jgi:hypothetical protein